MCVRVLTCQNSRLAVDSLGCSMSCVLWNNCGRGLRFPNLEAAFLIRRFPISMFPNKGTETIYAKRSEASAHFQ